MQTLQGEHIRLRALEPEDLQFLFDTENNEQFWEVSHTKKPFSKFVLKQYLENSHIDIYEAKQLRLIIQENSTNNKVGLIDLFDFNPQHHRAGIGILVHQQYQQNGYASEALQLLINYSFTYLNLHQLYANITDNNEKSLKLFKKHLFEQVGIKKDWIFTQGIYKHEFLFQLIND